MEKQGFPWVGTCHVWMRGSWCLIFLFLKILASPHGMWDLTSWPGIESVTSALEGSLNPWTTGENPYDGFFILFSFLHMWGIFIILLKSNLEFYLKLLLNCSVIFRTHIPFIFVNIYGFARRAVFSFLFHPSWFHRNHQPPFGDALRTETLQNSLKWARPLTVTQTTRGSGPSH